MNLNILNKILIILITIIIVGGFFGYRSLKKDLNIEVDAHQKLIKDIKSNKRQIIDSVQKVSLNQLKSLQSEVNSLSSYSANLITKIKRYEKNPNYDIDFITAVDIITRSNYSKRKNDTIKAKNN